MQYQAYLPALLLAVLGAIGNSHADRITLHDGTVLNGTISGLATDVLTVAPSFGGSVAIPWGQVATLESDQPLTLTPKEGPARTGRLQVVEGAQQLDGAALDLSQITALAMPAAPGAEGAPQPEPLKGSEPSPEEELWSGRAELGLNGQSGNKERFDVRAGIDLNRKTEPWRLNLTLKGQYAETDSTRSANEVMGGARVEVDISERTYTFGKVDLEQDEFEDLELRATVTTGLGHYFVKRDKLELKGWLGAGYEHERFEKDPEPVPDDLPTPTTPQEALRQILLITGQDNPVVTTSDEVVAEAGYSYHQDFRNNFKFKHGITYYPTVERPADLFRLSADTSVEFPVGSSPDWTVRAGMRNEYDSAPQEDIDKLDTTYYLNLGYNW